MHCVWYLESDSETYTIQSNVHPILVVDMSKWEELGAPVPVVMALRDLKFSEPTAIQSSSIPPALKDGKDVIGAAETVCAWWACNIRAQGCQGLLDLLSPVW